MNRRLNKNGIVFFIFLEQKNQLELVIFFLLGCDKVPTLSKIEGLKVCVRDFIQGYILLEGKAALYQVLQIDTETILLGSRPVHCDCLFYMLSSSFSNVPVIPNKQGQALFDIIVATVISPYQVVSNRVHLLQVLFLQGVQICAAILRLGICESTTAPANCLLSG